MTKAQVDGNYGDVMVVGGGISGIQASLDLATAGFRVYLVEKSPAIGTVILKVYKSLGQDLRGEARRVLYSRANWSQEMLHAIERGNAGGLDQASFVVQYGQIAITTPDNYLVVQANDAQSVPQPGLTLTITPSGPFVICAVSKANPM